MLEIPTASQNSVDESAGMQSGNTVGTRDEPTGVDSLYLEGVGDMVGIVTAITNKGLTMEGATVEVSDDGLFSATGNSGSETITVEYAPDIVVLLCEYSPASLESTCFMATLQDIEVESSITLWGEHEGDIFVADAIRILIVV